MKNFNYINLNQIKSNPDGQPTVNLQSRLMLHQGWFRNLAMIFAVLMLSIANIGNVWGTDYVVVADWRANTGIGNLTPAIGSTGDVVTFSPIVKGSTLTSSACANGGNSVNGIKINNNSSSNGGDFIDIRVPAGYRIKTIDSIYVSNTSNFSNKSDNYICYAASQFIALDAKSTSPGTVTSFSLPNVTAGIGSGGAGFTPAFPSGASITSADSIRCVRIYRNGQTHWILRLKVTVATVAAAASTKYTLAYDANGGSGSMPSHEFVSGTTVYAGQNAGFTPPTGKIFKCWNTEAEGGGTEYKEGDSFTLSANTTLYAQWITASTGSTYCISIFNLNVSDQMKYFTYSGYDDMQILDLEVPDYKTSTNNFWVGNNGSWYNDNLGNSNAQSANERLQDLCLKGNRSTKLGTSSQGVLARFFVYDNSWQNNLYIEFTPKQYSLIWGPDGSSWSPVKLYPSGYENEWTSEVVTLTSDQISSYNYYVGILKADNGVAYWYKSNTLSVGSMGTYNKPSDSWGDNVSTLSAGDKGFFRMWSDATSYDNWRCHFVPVYTLSYNANSGTGAPANAYVATEGDASDRTIKVSTTEPTRNGYSFEGWATSSANASAGAVAYAPGASITLSADQELWAVWECVDPTIGTDLSESEVNYYVGDAATALSVAATAAGGSVSYQWYSNTAKSTTSPTPTALTTGASYSPSTAAAGTTYYFCKITNSTAGCSNEVYSKIAKIVVSRINPTQYTVSGTASICAGGNTDITLSSSQVGASYQLKIGGSATGDAKAGTGNALTWNVSATGTYTVSAVQTTKYLARDMSGSATVSSKTATSVSFSDYTLDATEGESFEITGISAAGSGTLTYQWYSYTSSGGAGEDDIDGATSSTYTFTPAATGDYYFKCEVTGDCGSVKSDMITVTAATACSKPADPDGLSAGSISSSGVTFTITDDESPASYEIYYSTDDDAPEASTVASATTTSTTKSVTGLTANTTYYAWVRAVCDEDYKSDWVALTGSTFTTLAAGTKYYLFTPTSAPNPSHTGTLSNQFHTFANSAQSASETISTYTFTHWAKTSGGKTSWDTDNFGQLFIVYDIKTNNTDFTIYYKNGNASTPKGFYYAVITEGQTTDPTATLITGEKIAGNTSGSYTFNIKASKNSRICFFGEANNDCRFYQIVAEEMGTALPKPGEAGYKLAFKGVISRFAVKSSSNKTGFINDSVLVNANSNQKYGKSSSTSGALKLTTKGTNYLSFRSGASACQVKVCVSSSNTYYLGTSASATTNSQTSTHTFALAANTRYYINPNGSDVTVDSIVFLPAPSGYTVSIAANPAGYGSVSSSSVTSVASGTSLSTSTNTLSVGATDVTASATSATAEYTYAFSNWTKSDGTALPLTVTADLSVYANFTRTANNYTLTWNTNGGSDLDCDDCTSGSTAYGAAITAPNDPTLSNYTFDGWTTNNDGTGSAAAAAMPAANTTYYAAWKQTVTLTTGAQGSGDNQTPYVYLNGTGVSSFTAHTATGYTLQGYYTAGSGGTKVLEADGTFASANVDGYITSSKWSRTGAAPTLYAQWLASEDCSTSDFVIKKGSSTEFEGCMESSSYDGTATSFTAGSATTVGNAKMTISSYSKGAITRPGSGNTFSIVIEPVSGYYLKSICWAGKVENDETVSYYWDNNSGSATTISPQTTSGTGVTYDAPNSTTTKFTASYVDDGDDSGGIWWRNVQVEVCAGGATTYNVAYNGNDETSGDEPTDATNYSYGDAVTVLGNTGDLAKTNYTFAGWTTNDDGTGSSYVADNTFSITANTTLYAKWTQAVTFDANTANHGSTDGSATAVWNATGLTGITHATPASGYKLLGYYTTASGDGTKVLNADGTFAATAIDGYVTSSKWSRTGAAATLYARYESAGSLIWNLSVNTDATSLTTSSKESSFTEISTSNMSNATLAGELTYEKSKKSSLTGKISTPASYDADDYVYVTFQVASGYKFTPSSVKVIAQPVSTAKSVKLVLEDEKSHSINFTTASTISGGSTQTVEMTNGSSVYFEGTVTLKIYCYGAADAYRLGTPITIDGEVEETCGTMPSYTSMSYTTTTFLPNADASGSPITIVGGDNIDTYQWKYNRVNDRTSGTNCGTGTSLTPLTDEDAATDGTRYYWCEMTNDACGITIKSPAVAITVAAAKSDATVTWTDPASTPNYGGGGYTIKATVDQTGWDGNAADLVITAPAGINIYNVTSGTTSNQKWVQADFDVQTSFDRTTYASNIPFTVSAAATATYNAISNDHNVSYSACAGAGEGSSYNIRMRKTITKDGNYYHSANTDGWISPNISSSHSTAKAGTTMATVFDTVASSNTQYVWVRTYHANVNKVRIYADFRANDMTVSNVYKHTDYFSADSKYAVDYTAVYNGDEENENTGTAAQGYVDITLDEVMAANDILLVKFNDNKVRPLGAVITEGSAGSLNTYLQWSGGLADDATVAKYTTDAYFTYSASMITENTNSLGAITYSSSDPSVATVDATGKVALVAAGSTTINATLAASGCYKKAEISYTLNVTELPCTIAAGTLTLTSGTESKCSGDEVTLTLTGFESGAELQWKDGDTDINNGGNYTIETDGTTSTLTTNQEGTYSVMVTKDCSVRSNRITISNISTEVGAKRIVKNWYIKNGRLTPDIELWTLQNGAHLSSVAWSPENATGLTASDFYESDGKVYLKGKEPSSNTSEADIDYTLTLTVEDDCGSTTAMSASGQLIYLHHQKNTDKHVLAFVVIGTEKGGFTEGITAAQTTSVELYNTIAANFDVLATNVYSTDDEQALKEYYSQFDILCVTDYPNTGTKGVNKKSYVDALGALVDIRPILTMEAFVAKLANWKAKGISGTPQSPTTRQYTMLLQCKDHEIFAGTELTKVGEGEDEMYRVSMVDNTLEDYVTLDATYGGGEHAEKSGYEYGSKPALQGFTFNATMAADGLLPLGLIYDGAGNDLQVGIERQAEMEARLMVLGINGYAMERLTDDGQTVVVNALKYLMKKNEEDIADCSIAFYGGTEGHETDWNTDSNWKGGKKPDKTAREIRILAPVVITGEQSIHAQAPIKIASNGTYNGGADNARGSLTIAAGGALVVDGKIQAVTAPAYNRPRATSSGDLAVLTDADAQGALIFDNSEGETQATVQMYSPSYWEIMEGTNKKKSYWSYVAIPIQDAYVGEFFYGAVTYLYDETEGWIRKRIGTHLHAFEGIGLSLPEGHTETFYGPLAPTGEKDVTLTVSACDGENLIGNSWTAPIQIANFEASDFGSATQNVMIYSTGRDGTQDDVRENAEYVTATVENDGNVSAGQWVSIPINVPSLDGYDGLKVIPAMQAFQVTTGTETSLTLNYDKLVRDVNIVSDNLTEKQHAPARRSSGAKKSLMSTMRVRVSGVKTRTDVWLLEDDRFSDEFDNGWEAKYVECDDRSAQLYAQSETGNMSFLAKPDIEGTVLGFAPSKDGNQYLFTFHYVGDDEYYLNDLKLTTATLISNENNYLFTYEEGDTNRFYISRQPLGAPAVATGVDNPREEAKPRKFIYKDKMYILYNGRVFDATGKVVK